MEKVLLFIASLALTLPLSAQDGIERVVGEIAQHNTRLRASEAEAEATRQGNHADNTLQAPEISFGTLWGSPAGVGRRTDISVSQPFDLATVSGTRGRVARCEDRLADARMLLERRDVLLSARLTAIDVVYYNILAAELERRRRHAAALCQAQRRRLDAGETNIMEYNNARLALSRIETGLRSNEAERRAALATLTQMNGGEAVTLTDTIYSSHKAPPVPPRGEERLPLSAFAEGNMAPPSVGLGVALAAAKNAVAAAQARVALAKAEALPTPSLGYMSEKTRGEHFQGLTVGVSVPLWGAGRKIRQAKSAARAAEARLADTRSVVSAQLLADYNRARQLAEAAAQARAALAEADNTKPLAKAFEAGELPMVDYLVGLSYYYDALDDALRAEHESQRAAAAVRAYGAE